MERVLRVLDVEVADQLLGDRGAALHRLAARGQVLPAGADDRRRIDAAMAVEAPVLDGHRRVLEVLRDLGAADRLPDLVGVDHADQRAVGRVDLGDRPLRDRPQRSERGGRVVDADQPETRSEGAEGERRPEDHERDQEGVFLAARASLPPAGAGAHGAKGYLGPGQWDPSSPASRSAPCARSRSSPSWASRSTPASRAAFTWSRAPSGDSSTRRAEVTSPRSSVRRASSTSASGGNQTSTVIGAALFPAE